MNLRSLKRGWVLCAALLLQFSTGVTATAADDVVAKSSRARVTVEDIDRYIVENLPRDEAERAGVLRNPDVYKDMAETLYVMRAMAREAESAPGYDEAQARWAGEMAYQRRLVSDYRKTFIRNAFKDVDWESSAREEYQVHPEKYTRKEMIKASHILVKVEERSEREALDLIEEIHEKALAGEDFADLAIAFSDDSSSEAGGNLGYFKRGAMTPVFEETAFALQEKGDISEPVRSPFGYHIILLTDRKEAEPIPFAIAKKSIVEKLQTRMGNKIWQEKLMRVRSSGDIVYDEKALADLRKKYDKNPLRKKNGANTPSGGAGK